MCTSRLRMMPAIVVPVQFAARVEGHFLPSRGYIIIRHIYGRIGESKGVRTPRGRLEGKGGNERRTAHVERIMQAKIKKEPREHFTFNPLDPTQVIEPIVIMYHEGKGTHGRRSGSKGS